MSTEVENQEHQKGAVLLLSQSILIRVMYIYLGDSGIEKSCHCMLSTCFSAKQHLESCCESSFINPVLSKYPE